MGVRFLRDPARRPPSASISDMKDFRVSSAVLLFSTALSAVAAASGAAGLARSTRLPFIEDDYTRAVAEARSRGVPIFVEAWAPW
jgi:hypothetical protein